MLEIMRRLGTATSSLHRGMKDTVDAVGDAILDLCGNYGSRPRADRIVGAEHRTGMDILIITGAILLLSFAVLVLRFGSYKYPSERPAADLAR